MSRDRLPGLLHGRGHRRGRVAAWTCEAEEERREPVVPARTGSTSIPTHTMAGFELRAGRPLPFGATLVPGGVNFSVFSSAATACTLVLFEKGEREPLAEIPFPDEFRIGNVWAMTVFGLDYERPGVRLPHGRPVRPGDRPPLRPDQGPARSRTPASIGGRDVWGAAARLGRPATSTAAASSSTTSTGRTTGRCESPIEDLVIYEMHVRGFTRHPSSGVKHPRHLRRPAREDPLPQGARASTASSCCRSTSSTSSRTAALNPDTGELLLNYWGYSTVGFFAPKAGYAATGQFGMQVRRVQERWSRSCTRHGIEVILDVVFNHTAEGNEQGPVRSPSAASTTRPTTC